MEKFRFSYLKYLFTYVNTNKSILRQKIFKFFEFLGGPFLCKLPHVIEEVFAPAGCKDGGAIKVYFTEIKMSVFLLFKSGLWPQKYASVSHQTFSQPPTQNFQYLSPYIFFLYFTGSKSALCIMHLCESKRVCICMYVCV